MSTPAAALAPSGPREERRARFRDFVDREIAPHAGAWDRAGATPPEVVQRVARMGFLGALLPREVGGAAMDMAGFGELNEEMGRGCSSIRSLVTVHSMVSHAVHRWGSGAQKERWLPALARGETIGAFALSEPGVGSDAAAVETEAVADGGSYVLHGRKKWTTYGQIAGLFLVFARTEGKPLALLVERGAPGLRVEPLAGITGTRASMLAELHMDGCRVPRENRLGGPGFGTAIALATLDVGRFSVAAGCVGIIQACLDASLQYASERRQFGSLLREHQLVKRMVSDMVASARASRHLCRGAAALFDAGDPAASGETFVAKYFASTAATRAALDAVQIHGACGCTDEYPVERYLRDTRVMELIEGSTQIQQIAIADHEFLAHDTRRAVP